VRTFLRHLCACFVASGVVCTSTSAQSPPTVLSLLDAYAAGRAEQVVAELRKVDNLDRILEQLRRDGPGWIDAAGAAHAGIGWPWKLLQRPPSGLGVILPGFVLYWQAPPLLLEWACERLRARPSVHPAERWWHLAAVAVGHRSEDFQFMVGSPFGSVTINKQDEIDHVGHVESRVPDEMRIQLAKAIAIEWRWPRDAIQAFQTLVTHVRAELPADRS
jgi:hypothetical protein